MASETVRIQPETHAKLRQMARETGRPMSGLLEEAVEQFRRQRLLDQTNLAYGALRDDAKAWQEELKERQDWEATLGDGLEDQ